MGGDEERDVDRADDAGPFTVTVAGSPPVITVIGELTIETSPALAADVIEVVRAQQPAALVFELSGVTVMDSSGITVLVDAAARCHPVTVRNPSQAARRIIEAMGLTDVLRLEP